MGDKEDGNNDDLDIVETIVESKSNEINEPFQIKIEDDKDINSFPNEICEKVNISIGDVNEAFDDKLLQDDRSETDSVTIDIEEEISIKTIEGDKEKDAAVDDEQSEDDKSDAGSVTIAIEEEPISEPTEVVSSATKGEVNDAFVHYEEGISKDDIDTDKSDAGSVTIAIEEEPISIQNEVVTSALDVAVLNANNMEEAVQVQEKNIEDIESGPSSIVSTGKVPV